MKMTNNLNRSAFSLLTVFVSLLFSASTFALPQEVVRVSGKVSDQSGLSVIGAAVVEKGNPSNGVITVSTSPWYVNTDISTGVRNTFCISSSVAPCSFIAL